MAMHKHRLGSARFGVTTFFAYTHSSDQVGPDGLPVTPSAVRILGKFSQLKELNHKNLTAYIDIARLKNDRLVVVKEYYKTSVEDYFRDGTAVNAVDRRRMTFEIVDALAYLNRQGLVHRNLSPTNILISPEGSVKLYQYGLYYMTEAGRNVCFPIGFPRYMAPEVIADEPRSSNLVTISGLHEPSDAVMSCCKVDVWSLGIILLELFLGQHIYADLFLKNAVQTMLGRILLLVGNQKRNGVHPLDSLLEAHGAKNKKMEENLASFLYACLDPSPLNRLNPKELLNHAYLCGVSIPVYKKEEIMVIDNCFRTPKNRVRHLVLPEYRFLTANEIPIEVDHLTELLISEVYYLWCLAGGDLEGELKRAGIIRTQPPVCRMPSILTHDGSVYGLERDRVFLYDDSTHVLSFDQLRKRLKSMTTLDYYPLLEGEKKSALSHDSASLPTIIKERDVEYQFHRLILYNRLLQGYPYTKDKVVQQARIDICPFFRAEVWAVLLGVKGDIQADYMLIDKKSDHEADKQIAVDIPRCHQYDDLLSSPTGHEKFARVLKAWVVSHEQLGLVYWQGLDSLCAPFLALNFNNEALAYACLNAFINKYLCGFFKKNNSPIMQEYLAVFRHLIAFHDPELFNHLDDIGFHPELYAIPWYLTMFTHVLPLHKIYHLWDTLLLGNCAFPLCVGVAILKQVRDILKSYDFNECITLFSDMPDIDIQTCVSDAIRFFRATPRSACLRKHETDVSQIVNCPEDAKKKQLRLEQLKAESCAQVSCHDVITLCGLEQYMISYDSNNDKNNSTNKKSEQKKPQHKVLLIDIRPWEEFIHGHVPGAINVPYAQTITPEANNTLANYKGCRLTVVMGRSSENESRFAAQLLKMCYPRVCVLYGGIDALKKLGLLCSVDI